LNCDKPHFILGNDGVKTSWETQSLWKLFQGAHTPWDWSKKLQSLAHSLGMDFFSSPFDHTAVDFLESLDVPMYKIASMEMVDIPLMKKVAATGKPVIMSTGMATVGEIEEAVRVLRQEGVKELAILCVSSETRICEPVNDPKFVIHLQHCCRAVRPHPHYCSSCCFNSTGGKNY